MHDLLHWLKRCCPHAKDTTISCVRACDQHLCKDEGIPSEWIECSRLGRYFNLVNPNRKLPEMAVRRHLRGISLEFNLKQTIDRYIYGTNTVALYIGLFGAGLSQQSLKLEGQSLLLLAEL